jgi:hypothetical protein
MVARVPSTTANWWQYARWVRNISRNARITYPTGAELTAMRTFINVFCIMSTSPVTGTRPWLAPRIQRLMTNKVGHYTGVLTNEPAAVIVKMVDQIARDLNKVPPTAAEITACDVLIAATGTREIGSGPKFGGVIGDYPTPERE